MKRILANSLVRLSGRRMLSSAVIEQHFPRDGLVLDMTCGLGDHSRKVLTHTNCSVLALDCDSATTTTFAKLEAEFSEDRFHGEVMRWSEAANLLRRREMGPRVNAVMMDIGVNDAQMTDSSRGLNLRLPGPLDSRYCQNKTGLTLAELLANANVDDLETIFKSYAGVIKAKAIASEVLESRYLMQNLSTTEQLLELFQNAHVRFSYVWADKEEGASDKNIDKAFHALRRFVNDEINELLFSLKLSEIILPPGGLLICRIGTEFEDNLIKRTIFRKPGSITKKELSGESVVNQTWKSIKDIKDGEKAILIFEKCGNFPESSGDK